MWISLGATFLPIAVASLAAYAFAWLEFPGRDWLFVVVVALLVVPIQMALIPIFSLYNDLGLFDTIPGLVLFHTAFGLPFAIFLLRNFFIGIPRDLLEAARIDGASEFRIFFKVILPLGLPAIASLAIFQFLWVWNDLLVALTFARDTQPITVAIFSQMRQFSSNVELIAPAAFISLAIPARRLLRLPALLRPGTPGRVRQVGLVKGVKASREDSEGGCCAAAASQSVEPRSRGRTVSGLGGSPGAGRRLNSPGATSFGVSGWFSAARSWMCPRPAPSSHCPPPYAPMPFASQ